MAQQGGADRGRRDADAAAGGLQRHALAAAVDPAGGVDARLSIDLTPADREAGEIGLDRVCRGVVGEDRQIEIRAELRADVEDDIALVGGGVDLLLLQRAIHADRDVARMRRRIDRLRDQCPNTRCVNLIGSLISAAQPVPRAEAREARPLLPHAGKSESLNTMRHLLLCYEVYRAERPQAFTAMAELRISGSTKS